MIKNFLTKSALRRSQKSKPLTSVLSKATSLHGLFQMAPGYTYGIPWIPLKRDFCSETGAFSQYHEVDKSHNTSLYQYSMKMKQLAKESIRMVVKNEDIEIMNQPEFLGYIGVNMNDLEYYKIKDSAKTPSKV